MKSVDYRPRTHTWALIFALALFLLVLIFFTTFALGAYQVYNQPISNVVAVTAKDAASNSVLSVSATALNSSSSRIIWMDPQVSYDSNGDPSSVVPNSGVRIANAKSDSSGNLSDNISMSNQIVSQIENDGNPVHSLWIIGLASSTQNSSGQTPITSDSEKNFSAASLGGGITLFVTLYTFVVPVSFSFGTLFIFLWTAYLLLFAIALNGPLRSIVGALRTTSRQGLSGVFSNSMLAMTVVYTLIIGASVVITLLQEGVGVSTGQLPTVDPLLQYLGLTLAPIREEIGFRVIPIGLASFLLLILRGKIRDALLSLWHPSRYLKKNDNKTQYTRDRNISIVLIIIGALLFGLAHYVLGAGWGPGKITSAALAGIALGGLYYRYGLPAAILAHWADDYALSTLTQTPVPSTVFDLTALFIEALSVVSAVVLLVLFLRQIRSNRARRIFSAMSIGRSQS